MTIQEAKQYGLQKLTSSPSPQLDTQVFLQHILEKDKTFILFNRDLVLTEEQENVFKAYIESRTTGLPVAYITGHKEFYGYDFLVTPDVLIPKPDTEILVEKAVELLEDLYLAKPNRIMTVCDMCTGSGCVGISILKTLKDNGTIPEEFLPEITMVDISEKALSISRQNADRLLGKSIKDKYSFIRSNLFQMVGGTFDLIVSNPPYIPWKEARALLEDGRNEPLLALDGDINLDGTSSGTNDGLGIMRNFVPQSVDHLSPKGYLIVEAGEYNAEMTEYIFRENGLINTRIYSDLEGQLRDIFGQLSEYHSKKTFPN